MPVTTRVRRHQGTARRRRTAAARRAAPAASEALLRRLARSHNLTDQAYDRIVQLLGREPTVTEVGIFGVQWSEHCSYTSSKPYLKTFPTRGPRILVPAGAENAGLVDVGDGLAVAFKIESHNHPSAVEPHAGAATGVGGILRDIFTMGARPIALLDSLRFGPLERDPRAAFLLTGVVRGIADYGNCVGVPTVGGEIAFDESYAENPLVNVMCIGVVPRGQVARARATGVGNPVLYVGSSTGRDGLGGASFASREITEGSEADRPAVQIGDPFAEKCLIEATLEALATGDVVGIQDMGAAGLACSSCEMPSRGGTGLEIDVAKVPRRERGMTPYEVMLSESQERMLLIVRRGREAAIQRVFARWGLNAVTIGRVTGGGRLRVLDGAAVAADVPVKPLTDEAPVSRWPTRHPAYLAAAHRLSIRSIPEPRDPGAVLLRLLGSPTIGDKAPVFEQYDHMVQTNTIVLPGRADAAVLRLKGARRYLAAATDGNGRYCYLDPYEGGKAAVAEAARNVACVGAVPLAVTDCLNFGNPQDPEIMWQFAECVRGIAEACRAFKTPVTGGNVSFYNESPRGPVDPTPVIGMIGLLEAREGLPTPVLASFTQDGDKVILLGDTREELGGTEYLARIHRKKAGVPPRIDLAHEAALQRLLADAAARGLLKSAHDCAEGGLAIALAECCVMERDRRLGAVVQLDRDGLRTDALLFGETAGRVVISCERYHLEPLQYLAARHAIPFTVIGQVGGVRLTISQAGDAPADPWIDLAVDRLARAWGAALRPAYPHDGTG